MISTDSGEEGGYVGYGDVEDGFSFSLVGHSTSTVSCVFAGEVSL